MKENRPEGTAGVLRFDENAPTSEVIAFGAGSEHMEFVLRCRQCRGVFGNFAPAPFCCNHCEAQWMAKNKREPSWVTLLCDPDAHCGPQLESDGSD